MLVRGRFMTLLTITFLGIPALGIVFNSPTETQINSCIESLCGPAKDSQNVYRHEQLRKDHPTKNRTNFSISEFERRLRKIHQDRNNIDFLAAQFLERALSRNIAINTDQPLFAIFNYQRLPKDIAEKGSYQRIFTFKMDLEIEEHKLAEVAPLGNRLSARLKLKYPHLSLKNAQIRDAKFLLKTYHQVSIALGESLTRALLDDASQSLWKKAELGLDLDVAESLGYIAFARTLKVLDFILNDKEVYQLLLKVPFNEAQELQTLKNENYAKLNIKNISSQNAEKTTQTTLESCSKNLELFLDTAPSELRLKQAQKMIDEVRAAAKSVVLRFTDKISRPAVIQALTETKFVLPPSGDFALGYLHAALNSEELKINRDLLFIQDKNEFQQFALLKAILANNYDISLSQLGEYSDIAAVCGDLDGSMLYDKTMPSIDMETKMAADEYARTSLDKVILSPFTVLFPAMGAGILAHELGHVISSALDVAYGDASLPPSFLESRLCVGKRNPFSEDGAFFWLEEDWADYFSAQVLKVLSARKSLWSSSANLACSMVEYKNGQYRDNRLEPETGDTHSSAFLRLLMFSQDIGEPMTEQCRPILQTLQRNRKMDCSAQ